MSFDPDFFEKGKEVARNGRLKAAAEQRDAAADAIQRALRRGPATIPRIASSSLRSVEGVRSALLRLEAEGRVRRFAESGVRAELWEWVPEEAE